MAKTAKRIKGDIGEEVVCKYLEKNGYRIVERNYLRPWGEIDIIAERPSLLSFIEVKTVSRETVGAFRPEGHQRSEIRPEENMHPAKLKRLHRAVQTYLLDHKVPDSMPWQIDLACVSLVFSTHKARVELIENVIL